MRIPRRLLLASAALAAMMGLSSGSVAAQDNTMVLAGCNPGGAEKG